MTVSLLADIEGNDLLERSEMVFCDVWKNQNIYIA